jgi:hypothetical protein
MAIPVWDNPQISGGAKASILLVYRDRRHLGCLWQISF